MKKLSIALLVLVSLGVLFLTGCPTASGRYEFSGTWSLPLNLASWDFGDNGGSFSTSLINYTINFTYVTVDEAANHIQVNITSVTGPGGSLSGFTVGVPAYISYSISGNDILVTIDPVTYQTPKDGPYTKH